MSVVWLAGDHNYCRNVDGSMTAPWCFTGLKRRELCAVHKCGEQPTSFYKIDACLRTWFLKNAKYFNS